MKKLGILKFDWLTILIFLVMVGFGWLNIYSTTFTRGGSSFLDLDTVYGRQALWILLGFLLIFLILSLEAKLYERFASVIYIISILSLAGLFIFGTTISGSTSWYTIGAISIQPTEFAKTATALALAKYLNDIEVNIGSVKHQLYSVFIIFLPVLLIVPQPDPGSALVYLAFLIPLFREGISPVYLIAGLSLLTIFIGTLLFGTVLMSVAITIIMLIVAMFHRRKKIHHYFIYFGVLLLSIGASFSVDYVFNNVLAQRHRDRINLMLGMEAETQGAAYNVTQSKIAIGSGDWTGKGWLQGTQTQGGFVPEQHTDFIFSTVGEEWGFIGTGLVVILFMVLFMRLVFLAERQRSVFARVYGYSVIGILFIHFFINIGMVIGLLPTIGIPLPFFSYGGSSLWGFTILLFIFLKLDSQRKNIRPDF